MYCIHEIHGDGAGKVFCVVLTPPRKPWELTISRVGVEIKGGALRWFHRARWPREPLGHLTAFDMEITFLCFVCFYEVVAKMLMTFEASIWHNLVRTLADVPCFYPRDSKREDGSCARKIPKLSVQPKNKIESSAWRRIFHVIQVRDSLDTLLNCIHDSK